MHRPLRIICATAITLILCRIPALAGGSFWPPGYASPLLDMPAAISQTALLRVLAEAAEAPSRFAVEAAKAGTFYSEPPVATVPLPVAGAVVAPAASSVLQDIAFETALEAQFSAAASSPALRNVEGKLADLYRQNGWKPFWRDAGHWSVAAQAAIVRIGRSRDDALTLPAGPATLVEGPPETLAAQDFALTAMVVAYARQAAGDRIDPARISRLITARPTIPEPRDVVAAVAGAGDRAGDVLADYNPSHSGYRALRTKLAELRQASTPMASGRIPMGAPLRIGMRDARVKLIRARFGLEIDAAQNVDDVLYDTQVAGAVAGFQRQNGLPPSGVLTPRTVALLSGGEPRRLESEIVANMERWRWMPRDMGSDRIEVDIPNFTASLVRDGIVVHRTRVIVGKPTNPTPVFSNAMKFIVVNPSWFIPPSILKNEILPKLAADPDYIQRLGYEMTVKRGQISIRQPPGERNALGRIKFMFPNEHSVYLHDTPSRALFASTRRAFSHGCVRVDDPMALAAAVLRGTWTESRIKALVGRGERTLTLPTPLPIHLEYFTATVGADGRLQFRDDLYGYDRAVIRALASGE